MPKRVTGRNALAYLGVEAATPPDCVESHRAPTENDYQNFNIGTIWLVNNVSLPDPQEIWMLVSLARNIATWIPLYPSASEASRFRTDNGDALVQGGILNIVGAPGFITTTAALNPPNTVTIQAGTTFATTFQANIGSAQASGGILNIFGGSNLMSTGAGNSITVNLDDDVEITGSFEAGGTLHIIGAAQFDSGVTIDNGLTVATGGMEITNGGLIVDSLSANPGVIQTNSLGQFSSSHGTDGQILISRTTGTPEVAWANILCPSSVIAITNGPNSISLAMGGQGSFTDQEVFYWDVTTGQFATTTPGNPGEVLTYQGGGNPPEWAPGGGGGGSLNFLQGNSGGLVGPTGGGVINLVGDGTVTNTVGSPGTETVTVSLLSTTTAGQILLSSGTVATSPAYSTATYPSTIAAASVLVATASDTIGELVFDGTPTRYLANTGTGGTVPEWSTVDLTNGVSGILGTANGGTNNNSYAFNYGTLYFNGTEFETVDPGTATYVLTSQGAGMPPIFAPGGGGGGGGATTFPTNNTTAVVNVNTLSIVGDGTNIDTNGLTANTVTIKLRDSISLPNSNSAGTTGVIYLGGVQFINNYSPSGGTGGNTFVGRSAGSFTATGSIQNTGVGFQALSSMNSSCFSNTAVGYGALASILNSSSSLIAIGASAGSLLTSGSTDSILIGHPGVNGESDVIRIGQPTTYTSTYMYGIRGTNVGTISTTAHLVGINASEQLGDFTLTSTGGTVNITYPTNNTINLEAVGGGGGGGIAAFSYFMTGTVVGSFGSGTTSFSMGAFGGASGIFTQIFDTGANCTPGNGTSVPFTFTAPVSGKYYLNFIAQVSAGASNINPQQTQLYITTTSDTYTGRSATNTPNTIPQYSLIVDMTAGDTAVFSCDITQALSSNITWDINTLLQGFLLGSSDGKVASVTTNSGVPAIPSSLGELRVFGGVNMSTTGSNPGSIGTVTINMVGNPTIAGPVTISNLGLGVLQASSSGVLTSSKGTDGQVLISSTAAVAPAWANLTAGTGISITNGAGSITIAATTAGVSSVSGTTNQITCSPTTGSVVVSLPSTVIAPGSLASTTTTTVGTNLLLPTTTASVGQLQINGVEFLHNFASTGTAGNNTFIGTSAGNLTSSGAINNTGTGANVMAGLSSGIQNSAYGSGAMGVTTGGNNCAFGYSAMTDLRGGNNNCGLGVNVLDGIVGGSNNSALGHQAGNALTASDSSNVMISHAGVSGSSNTIWIGTQGSGAGQQNRAFMAGVAGVTVASSASVLINTSTGQLGTVVSSQRYKENIEPLKESAVLSLEPVTFTYKAAPEMGREYGLIAEQVAEVFPDLVSYKDEEPETVRYHVLPVLLLKELQNQRIIIDELKRKIDTLESTHHL